MAGDEGEKNRGTPATVGHGGDAKGSGAGAGGGGAPEDIDSDEAGGGGKTDLPSAAPGDRKPTHN